MSPTDFGQVELEGYAPIIAALRAVKIPVSTAPTYTPANLIEQFVLYESGATRRLYVWYGNASGWHYFTAT
jgi:hypothetical protein